jgi:putative hydrolase of the HAD superfamily
MSAGVKVVFFDAGGTLIHTAKPVGYYYALMAKHYGVDANGEALQAGFKQAWAKMKPRDPMDGARVMDDRAWWAELVKASWLAAGSPLAADFPFEPYFEEVYQLFAREEVWRIFPDAAFALEKLREKGVRCGVLSNWDRRLRLILRGLELEYFFERVIISSEIGVEKPHPGIFRHAEKTFGIQPAEALLLGDDEIFDGWGARSAGWQVELIERPDNDLTNSLVRLNII